MMLAVFVFLAGCASALPLKNRFAINYENNIDHLIKYAEQVRGHVHNLDAKNSEILEQSMDSKLRQAVSGRSMCYTCKALTLVFQQALRQNEGAFASTVDKICKELQVEASDICDGIVKLFKDEVLTVIDGLLLDPDEMCGFLLGSSCANFYDPYQMWNISLPDQPRKKKTPPTKHQKQDSQLRVLHLSDIHLDMKYQVGSNVNCDRPLCCRNSSGPVANSSATKAGQWGSYGHCDLPICTLEHLFNHLSHADKFDYIIWTGDLISHDDWDQTREEQLQLVDYLTNMFVKYFPHIPVYWAIGNHEGIPVNSFPPGYVTGNDSISWLYSHLAETWSHWLPKSTLATIKRGGFYALELQPGYRLVSLNMNYCNNQNWWMLFNTTDPTGELEWLVSQLYKAELANEKVHIIGHIAPGVGQCLKAWSWNYYKIVNRFSSTIKGQFFGHSHTDSLEIFYDIADSRQPLSVAYLAPSVTPFIGMNPAYRVYVLDGFYKGSTWSILDHETYIMNLTEANDHNRPEWTLEYSAKVAYNMKSLTPLDWHRFSEELLHNEKQMQQYYRYYMKSLPGDSFCDEVCTKSLVCSMRSGRSHDTTFCEGLDIRLADYHQWLVKGMMC